MMITQWIYNYVNIRAAPSGVGHVGIAYREHFEVQHASTQKCWGGDKIKQYIH